MAISNTKILVKRSSTVATPSGLLAGEIAYSYLSNTFFISNASGTGVVNIGGLYYTQTIDNATNNATALTLVKRDANGNASFNYVVANVTGSITGSANSATYLNYPQNFSISGGDISATSVAFGGNNAVTLNASLNSIAGLTAGTYGGTTTIPVVQVAANGRIMAISNTAISTSFTVTGNTGSASQAAANTLQINGAAGSGINTTITANGSGANVVISTDNTILRSNTTTGVGTVQTISTDLTVAGNLIVSGTQTFVNTSTVVTNDSLIKLAANNTVGDIIDIGFYGESNTGSSIAYHGIIREGSGGTNAGDFYVFKNLATDPTGNTVSYASLTQANLRANIISSNVTTTSLFVSGTANLATLNVSSIANIGTLNLTNPLGISSGGTNASSFSNGQRVVYNGTSLVSQANTGTPTATGSLVASNTITSLTFNNYGEVTAYTTANIAIGTTQITSGVLGYTYGGTGSSSYTTGQVLVAGATGFVSLANVTTSVTGSLATNNTITSITTDSYGRLTAYTGSAISGLTVSQGGTGVSTFTTNGITYGNGTGALGVTASAGTSDQAYSNQILTVTNAGVPTWSSALDGGTF
jgi:hypothetical protein